MPTTTAKKSPKKKSAKQVATSGSVVRPFPGYFRFSKDVVSFLLLHKDVFWKLLLAGVIASYLVSGLSQQASYADLTASTEEVSSQLGSGFFKGLVEVGALTVSIMTGALTSSLSESQQIYSGLLYVLLWLVTVWLIRHLASDARVGFRDGLYNASAPLLSTFVVVAVGLLQLLPLALFVWILSLVIASGVLGGTVLVLVGTILTLVLAGVTLYWVLGTLFAAIIVTIPGTYPVAALRSARELIEGSRPRILKRVLWLGLICFVVALVSFGLLVSVDAGLNYSIPFFVTLLVHIFTVLLYMYAITYIYLLYRGVIDERA